MEPPATADGIRPTITSATVEAEARVSAATVQLIRIDVPGPNDRTFHAPGIHWLDLCLTPRPTNARACYSAHWGTNRFEPIGDIFLVPPGETLRVRSDSGRQASIVCQFSAETVERSFDGPLEWTDRRLEANLNITSAVIRGLLLRLADEVRHPGFAGTALIELVTAQIAIELGRYWTAVDEGPAAGGLAAWRLRLIDGRVREIGAAPALLDLATICNLSVRQLTRGFRVSRGCSIGDHIVQSRMETAKRLLGTGESVKTVASAMGFASPSSFSYAFRQSTGATPRRFRQGITRLNR